MKENGSGVGIGNVLLSAPVCLFSTQADTCSRSAHKIIVRNAIKKTVCNDRYTLELQMKLASALLVQVCLQTSEYANDVE
jgi:hypothetical protein